ncbi:MAG TPA: POTRA domain-containing protein, partial [Blastocatellia bacterium]|nr:POTRA domain-containing protein [Blastocatellia bacterium]
MKSITFSIVTCLLALAPAAVRAVGRQLPLAGHGVRGTRSPDFSGKTITRIDIVVEGAPAGDTSEMRDAITIRAGEPYSTVGIHDSLYRLYDSGLVSAAKVEAAAEGGDGVAIKFLIRPQPRVDTILFQGNSVFAANELRAHLNKLDTGQRLTAGAVTRGATDLQGFYSTRGYYQANITSEVRLDRTGAHATVVYNINAGAVARISKFSVEAHGQKVDLTGIRNVLAKGAPFAEANVGEEVTRIKQVYLQHDFLAVQVNPTLAPDPAAGTVAIAINIDSGPLVKVNINGLQVKEKERRQIFPFYGQGGIDDFALEEGRRRLVDYAQQQGFFFAEVVKPDLPEMAASSVTLDYSVTPGRRYRLASLDIRGLSAIPPKTILDEMKSKPASLTNVLIPRRGVTSNEFLRQDGNLIAKRLRELGYRRSHVDVLRGVSPAGDDLIVTFTVSQGPRTYVDAVGIRGNNVLTAGQLGPQIPIQPGEPLVTSVINKAADQILTEYSALGYADAEVSPEVVDEDDMAGSDRVRVIYNIAEGPRVRILSVSTHGTAHIDKSRLEHDFYLFRAGDWLRNSKLQDTERILYDTNAFSSVTVHSDPAGRTPTGIEQRDVTVDLAEAKRFLLIYGFGYQSNNGNPTIPGLNFLHGLRGLAQLTDTDLMGKLYTGSIQLRVSEDEVLGQLSFENPRPFGYNWPTIVSAFARGLAEASFRTNRYTAVIQTQRRLSPNSILYFSYNFERITVLDLKLSSILEIERNSQPVRLGRVGPSFLRDTRDNAFDPTRGTLTTASFSVASVALGGNEQFVKGLVEHDRYYAI